MVVTMMIAKESLVLNMTRILRMKEVVLSFERP